MREARRSSRFVVLAFVVAAASSALVATAVAASAWTAASRASRTTCDVTLNTGFVYGSDVATAGNVCVAPDDPGAAALEWGNYTWQSLTIESGAELVVTLQHSCGGGAGPSSLTLTNGGTIQQGSTLGLSDSVNCFGGGESDLYVTGGTLVNQGTLSADACDDSNGCLYGSNGSTGPRGLSGSIVNRGTIRSDARIPIVDYGGALLNQGTITLGTSDPNTVGHGFDVASGAGASVVNGTNGSIDTTDGDFFMDSGNTFVQGAGSATGTPLLLIGDTIRYTGAGASHVDVRGPTTLSGNIAGSQTLELQGQGGFCQYTQAAVTAATSFTNAGTIVTTQCNGNPSLSVSSGTLTNKGTIESQAGLDLHATVTNRGTIQVDSNTTITIDSLTNYSAATNTLTGGTYVVAGGGAGMVVPGMDVHTNAASVTLTNGSLSDGGNNALRNLTSNQGKLSLLAGQLSLTGNLTNSGTLELGWANELDVGAYTQSSGGRLIVHVAGNYGGPNDQLRDLGAAMLAGGLSVVVDPGYTPAAGDQDQFMAYASSSGAFTAVSGTSTGGGLHDVLEYDTNDATLVFRRTKIVVNPTSGAAGSTFEVRGQGFSPGETVTLSFGSTALPPASANGSGQFDVTLSVPSVPSGTYAVSATGATSFVTVNAHFQVT